MQPLSLNLSMTAPQRRIATFGDTSFRFYLVTELMDSVGQVRVRDGRLHADKWPVVDGSIAFTGGIGENAHGIRKRIIEGAAWLGAFETRVLHTDEEAMIARHTAALA